MIEPVSIGLIGCGVISSAYLKAASTFNVLNFTACADINADASARCSETFDIPSMRVDELLARSDIEVILNLTIPSAHADVNQAALQSGKHAYCEKPFALNTVEGQRVIKLAEECGLRVGCAPDTFLGGGHQTVRNAIDEGVVGQPIAGTAFMMNHGHESWHPNPAFYYQEGGGPLFDMGPYYLTALVNALGPVRRVTALTGRAFDTRNVGSEPRRGEQIRVDVDTHTAGTLEFTSGAIVTVVMSFDVWLHSNRFIEIHGTNASLSSPDPNGFGGSVRVSGTDRTWDELPLTHGYLENMRSIGLADMCVGIRTDRPHRCSGEIAYHVLEIMEAFEHSSAMGKHIELTTIPDRPDPLPMGLTVGELD